MNEKRDIFVKAFSGRVNLSDLKPLRRDYADMGVTHLLYECPCGEKGHAATRSVAYNTGKSITASPVLHCYHSGKQWLVVNDIERIIETEERNYIRLLQKFEASGIVGKNVTAKEAFTLTTERGVPEDILEIEDLKAFELLKANHRNVSRKG